jgi:hypothetical protein
MKCCRHPEYQLPAVPEGHLYDWYSFQYFNVPTITVTPDGYNFAGSAPLSGNLRDVASFVSQSPGTSFQGVTCHVIPGVEECEHPASAAAQQEARHAVVTAADPMATASGLPVGLWAGPGPFYAGGRAIMRAMYYPNGPQYEPERGRWVLNGEADTAKWLTSYMTRRRMEATTGFDFNTGRQWCNGFREGDQVEIGHVQQIPGMPASTGYWYNYFGGGGTGVFHRYGRTPKVSQAEVDAMRACLPSSHAPSVIDIANISPRNKAHVLFNLLWEVKHTQELPQRSGGAPANATTPPTSTQNGAALLTAFYGTDDPWIITMWYANGYAGTTPDGGVAPDDWTRYDEYFQPQGKACPDFNGFSNPLMWAQPAWMGGGGYGPNQKLISRQVDTAFALSVPSLGAYELPAPAEGNVSLHNLYGVMEDASSGVTFATLCAFLLQAEFGPDDAELEDYVAPPHEFEDGTFNTLPNLKEEQFPLPRSNTAYHEPTAKGLRSTGGVGALTYLGVQYALTKVFLGNYFYDRVANGVSFDEPMNYFALVLGYDDIQMTCNTNTNGVWSFENVYVGLPRAEDGLDCDEWAYTWRDTVIRTRKYPYITGWNYQSPAAAILNQLFASTNSARDPFDVADDGASLPCYTLGGFSCENTPGMSCQQTAKLEDPGWGAYERDVFAGVCTAEANAGMNADTTSNVLWDARGRCHHPWSQGFFSEEGDAYMSSTTGMGHTFCQAPGDTPTLSAIWGNVPYGGQGYGTGLVPLYTAAKRRPLFRAGTTALPTRWGDGPPRPPPLGVDPRALFR